MDRISRILLRRQSRNLECLYPLLPEAACTEAAKALHSLERGNTFIVTGFYCFTQGETDGPIGSHFLALALQKMGFHPIVVTDKYSLAYFQKKGYAAMEYGFQTDAKQLLQTYAPKALLSVERCGRAADGHYYSMKKKNISAVTPPIDELFIQKDAQVPAIGIGDGGNEIGMGNFHDTLLQHTDLIPSCIRVDYPIAATVSNWGAYGLIASLEETARRPLLPTEAEVMDYLQEIVRAGAPDGILGPGHCSVDGFDLSADFEILAALRENRTYSW